jgi:hypothetical protein
MCIRVVRTALGNSKWYTRLMFYDVGYVANDITYVMLMLLMVLLLLRVLCSWLVEWLAVWSGFAMCVLRMGVFSWKGEGKGWGEGRVLVGKFQYGFKDGVVRVCVVVIEVIACFCCFIYVKLFYGV